MLFPAATGGVLIGLIGVAAPSFQLKPFFSSTKNPLQTTVQASRREKQPTEVEVIMPHKMKFVQ